jgi:fluoride ion exporter CrcB/FEX
LARYWLSELLVDQYRAVFFINQLGVLFAGLIIFKFKATDSQKLFWIAGFSGGFTTFSSFAVLNMGNDELSNLIFSVGSFVVSYVIIRLIGRVKNA